MRCVPGVTSTIRANCRDGFQHSYARGVASARTGSAAIVSDWAGAGAVAGLSLGGAFGLVFGIVAWFGPVALVAAGFGVLLGGLLGLASGAANGVANGIVLACLFSAGTLGQTEHERRWMTALAAGLTSAVASLALFDWALGTNTSRWLSVCVPAAVATLAGVALSQMLEPIHSDARP